MLRGRVVEVLEAVAGPGRTAVRVRPSRLRRLRLAARRPEPAAAQARHHPRRAQPHRRIADPPLAEPVALPTDGFRTTVRALVVDGKPAFRKHQSHDPVLIDSCLVAHPRDRRAPARGPVRPRDGSDVARRRRYRRTRRARRTRGDRSWISRPTSCAARTRWCTRSSTATRMRVSINSFFQSRTDGAATLARTRARGDRTRQVDRRPLLRRRPVRGDRRPTQARRRGRTRPRPRSPTREHNLTGCDRARRARRRRQVARQQGRRRDRRSEPRRSRQGRRARPCSRATPTGRARLVRRGRARARRRPARSAPTTSSRRSRSSICSRTRRTSSA